MSHFLVMVIGSDVEGQLAPYDENLSVVPYEVLIEKEEIDRLRSYAEKEGRNYKTTMELMKAESKDWFGRECYLNNVGLWAYKSQYNHHSKWDWYEIGGRWAGQIKVKDGVEYDKPNFSYGWSEEDKKKVLAERRADTAKIKDIANLDELHAYAVVRDGEWIEKGRMGWWGISTNENDNWDEVFKTILADIDQDEVITFVDCHI